MPPVQNIAIFRCFAGSRWRAAKSLNWPKLLMPGSTAPSNVPIATSKALRVSITSVSGAVISAFQSARLDIGADLPRRIDGRIAERDDFLLQPDLQPRERHSGGVREFEFEIVEPAAEQGARLQLLDQRVDGRRLAGKGAVDALMRQQHAALQPKAGADRAQRLAQLPEIRQRGELVEGGDLERHGDRLSGGQGPGNPAKSAGITQRLPGCRCGQISGIPAIALSGMNMPRTPLQARARHQRDAENAEKKAFPMRNFHFAGRSTVHAQNAMVATSHPAAALVAVDVMRAGGTAADAAVAACALLGVIEPQSTGIGGDCFALVQPKGEGKIVAYNGSGRAPMAATAEWYLERKINSVPLTSAHAVSIPGAIDAWDTILRDHGKFGLDKLLQPAIKAAEEGYIVAPRIAFDWKNSSRNSRTAPTPRAICCRTASPRSPAT